MDLMQGLSAPRLGVEKGGRMATMRGMDGHIFVEGAAHVRQEVAMQLRAIRESRIAGHRMNLVTPTISKPPRQAPAAPQSPATRQNP